MRNIAFLFALTVLMLSGCVQNNKQPVTDDPEWRAHLLLDSALEYMDYQRYDVAMVQLKEAEKLLPFVKNDSLGYRVCLYIGWMNEQAGAHELALDYERMAQMYADATENSHFIVNAMIHQVTTLNNMGRVEEGRAVNNRAMAHYNWVDPDQQSAIMCNRAYYKMLADSLDMAERMAYRAAMLGTDSASVGNAITLLCRIHLKKGDERQAQILLNMIPETENLTLRYNRLMSESELQERQGDYLAALNTQKRLRQMSDSIAAQREALNLVRIQNQYDQQWHLRRSAERHYKMSLIIIAMMCIMAVVTYIYWRRTQARHHRFQQRISTVRAELDELLSHRTTQLDDLKMALDANMDEIERMKNRLPSSYAADQMYVQISEIKRGIDVLYDILHEKNISQYGKQEQHDVMTALWLTDRKLAAILDDRAYQFTPKEVFFAIMEHYGIPDSRKLFSFVCTESALRSTKSRLSKKISLNQLR